MTLFRVRYTGQWDEEVESDNQFYAEMEAAARNENNWIAEEICDEDENVESSS